MTLSGIHGRPDGGGGKSWTAAGTAEAEVRVAGDLDRIVARLTAVVPAPPRLGLLLIGGFGRGEGGVIRRPDGSLRAFNDYDLALIVDRPVDPTPVAAAARDLAAELEIDFVDVGLVELRNLQRRLDTIYAFELREGHRVLDGPADLVARMPAIDPARLPLIEATRLLVNRGLGLLWARIYLENALASPATFDGDRRRFTINAIHKAALAMGEAALIAAGQYHLSYRERAARVACVPIPLGPALEVRAAHAAATRFKLQPVIDIDPPAALAEWWARVRGWHELIFRWIEERRLATTLARWGDYAPRAAIDALRRGLRHPRVYAGERVTPGWSDAWWGHLLDAETARRIRMAELLYDEPAGWPTAARELLEEWHP